MRRNFKKSIAGVLASLMVLGSLQPLNVQAMEIDSSMIEEMEISNWKAEGETTDLVYNFNQLEKVQSYNVEIDVDESGAVSLNYSEQYAETKYMLPADVDFSKVQKVTLNLTSGTAGELALKLYSDGAGATQSEVAYGAVEMVPTQKFGSFGIMSMADTVSVEISGVTFTVGEETVIEDSEDTEEDSGITYGDNIIVNPNFADEDMTAWNREAGASIITAEISNEAIFDDVTTYGKIERDPATSSTQDCFSQDITEVVEKGEEYQFSFYAMLSDEYADAPTEQRKVEFCPYFVDAEGNPTYLGTYSSELTGNSSQALTPGEWTEYSGTFKISCTGDDKVYIRIIEQGTNYGSGDCVLGDYYITGVSLKKINKPKPEIEKDIPNWKDAITEDLGEDAIAGTCFGVGSLSDEVLMELATKHFNAVSFENELKPDALLTSSPKLNGATFTSGETTIEVPDLNFTNPNKMLDFIKNWNEENDGDIKVRGHVLVWHSQTPEWFFHENYDASADYVDKEEMNIRLEWYIKTVLEYYTGEGSPYADMFYGWDVVNEAISDTFAKPRKASENSSWAAVYGDQSNEYIINAFRFANQYAPAELELYYNDYNDCVPSKCAGITELLADIKEAEGTRIDAMGMQSHHGMDSPTISQIEAAVRSYAGVVGKVQLTELDLKASNSYDGTDATRADEYTKQAYRYKEMYDLLVSLDAEDDIDVSGITMWGTIDKLSWLQSSNSVGGASNGGSQCPLLFDDDYHAKPAFWAFVNPDKLEPAVQKVTVVQYMDDTFSQGKVYSINQGETSASFVPMWDEEGLKILVNVSDANNDATDAVTVYVDPAMTKGDVTPIKVTVNRAEATEVEGGYETIISIPLDTVGVAVKVGFDVVVVNGTERAAFNDLTNAQDSNSKYYAEAIMKPYATIARTATAVTVDGEADSVWSKVDAIPLSINLGSEVAADVKVLWDAENLYVYAEVTDAVLDDTSSAAHEQDSLEVFIDENNSKSESYEEDDKQYRVNYKNVQSFNGTKCIADNINSATKITDAGYVVEAAYKWTDITPAASNEIGLELQINDAKNGSRIGTLSWYDDSGMGWSSTAVYGTVKLSDVVVAGDNNDDENVVEKDFDFEDVEIIEGQWKYEAVKYVYNRGIMGKVGASNLFQPDNTLTRAMFATVLYRVAGEPAVEFVDKFPDVEEGKWYSNAIIWANQNGIVSGYTTGYYGINDNITREQIAKMLCEYAKNVEGYDVSGSADISQFTDPQDVSGWATDYIKWAVDAEMISGKPNGDGTFRIDPKGQATRAECAKMIQKFMEKY